MGWRRIRRYGCLEVLSQTAMEGTIGQLGRIMPQVALHARGRYTEDEKAAGHEAMHAALVKRRAGATSQEEAILDELIAEAVYSAEYETLPCRKRSQNYQYTMADCMEWVDTEIAAGRVTPYAEWVQLWRRYMAASRIACALAARFKLRRSRKLMARMRRRAEGGARTYGAKLVEQHCQYYASFPLRAASAAVDGLICASEQRARKADWSAMHKRMREDARARAEGETD